MKIMKRKILTMMLCCTMVLSLAACGSKQEEPVNAEATEQSEEKDEADEAQETVKEEEPVAEPEAEEPEQVELTADTIDKYFGFEYADVADDAITGFDFSIKYQWNIDDAVEYVSVHTVPCKYSNTEHPIFRKELKDIYLPGIEIFSNRDLITAPVSLDTGDFVLSQSVETPLNPMEVTNNITSMGISHVDLTEDMTVKVYPVMMPRSAMNAYIPSDNNAAFILMNPSDEYINVDEALLTYFKGSFVESKSVGFRVVSVGGITEGSTVQDAAKVVAPTSGTMLDNGAIVLTWVTASGTTVEITFAADTYKALSLKVLSADMTPEILNSLGIR